MNPIAVLVEAVVNASYWLLNLLAGLAAKPDFVVIEIAGRLPERRSRLQGVRGWLQRRFRGPQESLEEWRERLKVLAGDPHVKGVILTIGDLQAGLTTLESLRRTLETFRASGKRLVAYVTTTTLRTYYLASVADTVVAPESAELALHGLRLEATFLREALDRLGVLPQFQHIGEYKSAANRFLHPEMREPQREMLTSLLESTYAEIVAAIANTRHLPIESVRGAIDRGILSAADGRERRLIDAIAFADQLPTLLGRVDRPANMQSWGQAQYRVRRPYHWRSLERQAIGVVQLLGTIVPGESRDLPIPLPLVGQQLAGHESITRALRRVERSPYFKAVIFHVDSPGGSAVASDLIWREIARIQQQKPVVVFMGDVAGSGGYYVACGARHIVAGATTLTGSIGVIAGKLNLQGMFEKAGVHRDIVAQGATAAMPSVFASYTDAEWAILRGWMEDIYQRFKTRVAMGRSQSLETIEAIAQGRVWTGRQALDRGLVDEIGDFDAVVRQAKHLAGIPIDADVPVLTVQPAKVAPWPAAAPAAWEQAVQSVRRLFTEHALLLMPPDSRVY